MQLQLLSARLGIEAHLKTRAFITIIIKIKIAAMMTMMTSELTGSVLGLIGGIWADDENDNNNHQDQDHPFVNDVTEVG